MISIVYKCRQIYPSSHGMVWHLSRSWPFELSSHPFSIRALLTPVLVRICAWCMGMFVPNCGFKFMVQVHVGKYAIHLGRWRMAPIQMVIGDQWFTTLYKVPKENTSCWEWNLVTTLLTSTHRNAAWQRSVQCQKILLWLMPNHTPKAKFISIYPWRIHGTILYLPIIYTFKD